MNWYPGNIVEAVNLSKARNAVFVVYIDGNDEQSEKLRGFINEEQVKSYLESGDFVAIRIASGSELYLQFVQIYQVVPVPSLFFIGKNGVPLEIITGIVKSVEDVVSKISNVLQQNGYSGINPKKSTKTRSPKDESEQLEHNNSYTAHGKGVCLRVSEKKETSTKEELLKKKEIPDKKNVPGKRGVPKKKEVSEEKETAEIMAEGKIVEFEEKEEFDRAPQSKKSKQIIDKKIKEREAIEVRANRESEFQRRKQGQDGQNLQKWQKKRELQQLKENLRRVQLEEQTAKQQILKKIASDRAEQAQKFGALNPGTEENQWQDKENLCSFRRHLQNDPGTSRIQFRKPNGENVTSTFKSSDKFLIVREYVKTTVLSGSGIKEFTLATTFPKKQFTLKDDKEALFDLGLCPNAVLLVLTTACLASGPSAIIARSGGFINIFNSIVWGILSPILAAFTLLKSLLIGSSTSTSVSQKRANQTSNENDARRRRNIARLAGDGAVSDGVLTSFGVKRKESAAYRQMGNSNIHRLVDNKDSDEENNTWNGNSTQQQ